MLFHISYDVRSGQNSEALRTDIVQRYLQLYPGIAQTITEPTRSTLRFVLDVDRVRMIDVLSVMREFESRCFFFVSASESYTEEGRSYFPSITAPNTALNSNFRSGLGLQ